MIPGLHVDPESPVPVYRQIADGVRDAVRDGRLALGHRLPPTRDLARQLGVNRNTVVAAYDSLAEDGWVRSHTGRGTFLVDPTDAGAIGEAPRPDEEWTTTFARAVDPGATGRLVSAYQLALTSGGISFSGSYPAADLMPVAEFGRAMATALREDGTAALTYGPTAGLPRLRERIAAGMREAGSTVEAGQIVVTSGAQQAIELAFHTFLERGDPVVIEEPTYAGALSVLESIGARIVGVPVDEEGLRPDLLELALERQRPRLLYVQPTHHNPTTAVMSERRRHDVLALAMRHRCLVVEDDWASGLAFEGPAPPTLHALDGGRHVLHISSFSKKLLPGLRAGWLVAPRRIRERVVALKQTRDFGTSPLVQAALDVFLREDGLDEHLERVLPVYRERRDAMLAALERHLPREATYTRPSGGLFVWVTLPRDVGGEELFLAARQAGLSYARGDMYYVNGDGAHQLRLTFSTLPPETIERGVRELGTLIGARASRGSVRDERQAVESIPTL